MNDRTDLDGLRILVVEDVMLVAAEIADQLQDCGCEVVGPTPRVASALALARTAALDGALLDVNLDGEPCFPVAEALGARGVPFIFLTGYDGSAIPPDYRSVPRMEKPVDGRELARLIGEQFHPRE